MSAAGLYRLAQGGLRAGQAPHVFQAQFQALVLNQLSGECGAERAAATPKECGLMAMWKAAPWKRTLPAGHQLPLRCHGPAFLCPPPLPSPPPRSIDNIRDLFGHKVSLNMVKKNPICRLGL